jgi:hypothetical protein
MASLIEDIISILLIIFAAIFGVFAATVFIILFLLRLLIIPLFAIALFLIIRYFYLLEKSLI